MSMTRTYHCSLGCTQLLDRQIGRKILLFVLGLSHEAEDPSCDPTESGKAGTVVSKLLEVDVQ